MKTLINLGLIGLVIMYIFDNETYLRMESYVVHVIHYLLILYVLWILFSDVFKSLRHSLGERFGLTIKRMKRKIFKMKQKIT